ncbi:DUF2000 family protein [Aquihabitans daechungensis]|uniref:DUF2000 family protein n=1 Tax=Aquihabitans daechungensis TaxID=1052257 RepID=UPI003BA23464
MSELQIAETPADRTINQRIALVVNKRLTPGAAANVAALAMGQLVLERPTLYAQAPVPDAVGRPHAAIRYSTVILKAGAGQLDNLSRRLSDDDRVAFCCFSTLGQSLNNAFDEYAATLAVSEPELAAVGLSGDDPVVRELTRAFSVLT